MSLLSPALKIVAFYQLTSPKFEELNVFINTTQALEEPHSDHKVLLTALAEAKGGVRGFLSLNLCNHLRMPAPYFLTGDETFAQCITSSREEGVSRCQREIKKRSMGVNMIQIHYRCTKSHNGMPYYLK